MKILLFSPLLLDKYHASYDSKIKAIFHKTFLKTTYHKSLGLESLAEVTPKKHEVIIKKAHYNNVDFDDNYDLIGIRSITIDAPSTYKMSDRLRKRGHTVVLGGYHPSAMPKEAKKHADSVVIGEGEKIWPQLLKDFENNRLKPFYHQSNPVESSNIPTLKNHDPQDFYPAIQASRGCPYQCEFCSETIVNTKQFFRPRSIDNVIEEIKSIPTKSFIFHDASLTINPTYTKKLFRSMIKLNKRFFCNGNADILGKDVDLLRLARDAGCVGWLIGFESISQKSLDGVKKKTNIIENYEKAIDRIHDHNMMVCGTFVLGFDGDTIDVFDRTKEFVYSSGIDIPDALILTPFPGTALFNRLDKSGRILTKDWSKYDHRHVVFKPKNMTSQQLLINTNNLYKDFFRLRDILKRSIKSIKLGYYPFLNVFFPSVTMATVKLNPKLNN